MGKEKKSAPGKVRTVRDLIRLADDIGVQPSVLIWLESLTLPEVEQIGQAIRPDPPSG